MKRMMRVSLEAEANPGLTGKVRDLWEWWSQWQHRSINRRIFAAMVTVASLTVIVKLAAAIKEVVTAYRFGTSDYLDAFLIACILPQFGANLIGGSLNAALIPAYIQMQERHGRDEAQRLLSSVMVLTTCVLLGVCLLMALMAPYILPILASGFEDEKLALTQSIYYLMLSTLVLSGVSTIWGAVLNAHHRFALVALVPMITSIVTILALTVSPGRWSSYVLAIGAVAGALLEIVALGLGLSRTNISIIPRWSGISPDIKQVMGQYLPMIAASFLMGGAGVVTQAMAAGLDSGSVAALGYGNKVVNLIVGIGAVAVSTAVLPHFSKMVALKDWTGLRHTLATYTRVLVLASVSVTLVLICFSEPLVALLFERGAFSRKDTHLVSQVQTMFLLQIPPYIAGMLFVRLISALKSNQAMLWGNLINLTVCIALGAILMPIMGVAGIALATSIMCMVSFGYLMTVALCVLRRQVA
jgi:putative peptidoglycan lipid II flippase